MLKKFEDYNLNESFRDNKSGMALPEMMNHKSSYHDRVANHIIDIITNERGISEKSFRQYDEVIDEVENFYNNNKKELDDVISIFINNNWRVNFCAEKIYADFFQTKQ